MTARGGGKINSQKFSTQMEPDDFAARYLCQSGVGKPSGDNNRCEAGEESRTIPTSNMKGISDSAALDGDSAALDGVPVFATKDNLDKAFAILSQEMNMLGFTMLQHNGPGNLNFVHVINAAYELLQQHKHNIRLQEDLETRNSKTTCDINHLHVNQIRLKNSLSQTEKSVKILQEKERQLLDQNKCLQQKLKSDKDELKKLTLFHQQREAQYEHDIRKRERETAKLKERLNQLLSDRVPDRRLGIEILNSLPRKDGSRGKWKTSAVANKREEELYRTLLKDYEERHRAIIEENNILRHLLFKINDDIMVILRSAWEPNGLQDKNPATQSPQNVDETCISNLDELNLLSEGHFYLPIETLHRLIRENFQLKFKFLGNFVSQFKKAKVQSGAEDSNEVQEAVDKFLDITTRQNNLLQKAFSLWNSTDLQKMMPNEKKDLMNEYENLQSSWKSLQTRNDKRSSDEPCNLMSEQKQVQCVGKVSIEENSKLTTNQDDQP